jgi:hypothetical protein
VIILCVHCLKQIDELKLSILPPNDADEAAGKRDPKEFVVKVQKLFPDDPNGDGNPELVLNVITDDAGVSPEDVLAADQLFCCNCGEVLDMQIHCCTIRGHEVEPDPDDGDSDSGYVLVATMGASSRLDVKSPKEIRDAVKDLVVFEGGREMVEKKDARQTFEWDQ